MIWTVLLCFLGFSAICTAVFALGLIFSAARADAMIKTFREEIRRRDLEGPNSLEPDVKFQSTSENDSPTRKTPSFGIYLIDGPSERSANAR